MPSLSYAAWNVYTVALREAHSNLRLNEVDEKIWLWRWHISSSVVKSLVYATQNETVKIYGIFILGYLYTCSR